MSAEERDAAPDTTMSGRSLPVDAARDGAERPGEFPYTRGPYTEMYRRQLWTMRMFAGFGAPEDTNRRFHALLEAGQTGLSTAFDMPALMGYDPDHPLSAGEVGREGVSLASAEDMERLYAGLDLGAVSTSLTISGPAPVALAMFVVAAERAGTERARLRGTLQTDILKEFIAQKEWLVPERPSMRLVGDLIAFSAAEMPQWHPVSVSGYHIREAGATAGQELAFTIADGLAYAQEMVGRGFDADEVLPRFSFFFNAQIDLFEEVAKLRAARRLWATLVRERFGARSERSLRLRTHVQTSGVSLTAQGPLLNVARTAVEALAAVLGGAQSLHTNAWDETLALPTEESARLALRTQQMLAFETGAAGVADPLGGSWLVERLTDEVEAEARGYLDEIDRRGGMVQAVIDGYPQARIAEAAYDFQRELDEGRRVMVGVNAFPAPGGEEPRIHRADPEVERLQVERVQALRAARDAGAHAAALDAVRAACRGTDNVMPPLIAAADAGATVGELCDVFREVWGVYRDPGGW